MEVNSMPLVGKSMPKYDGLDHVTGATQFVDDIFVPGTLVCKGFRSPVHKGVVKSIDTSAAEKLPGVYAVLTAKDVPNNVYNGDQPVFATSIRFKGELLAAVAAIDEDTALEALEHIKVDIEEETPVFDPFEALKPDAPKVKPEGNLIMFGDKDYYFTNHGDIEKGFSESDYIVEGEYFYQVADQAPLETQTSLAVPHANGNLTVYTTTQALYFNLAPLANVLQMPMSRINYVGATVGGAFGAKNDLHADPVTALLALKTGRPVKWRWTREEELTCSTQRGAWIIKIKDGVRKDGKIIARYMEPLLDAGSYGAFNAYSVLKISYYCVGPYYIPNVQIKARGVMTNKPPRSTMRGFAVTPCSFASEAQMERVARTVGIDSFEIRMINALRKGEKMHTGNEPDSVGAIEVMQKLAQISGKQLPDEFMKMNSYERRI